jgi:hypothetical protein
LDEAATKTGKAPVRGREGSQGAKHAQGVAAVKHQWNSLFRTVSEVAVRAEKGFVHYYKSAMFPD